MTRAFHLAAALCLCALPLGAQTLSVGSQVTSVTMYYDGADVTRQVEVTLPAGVTEVILPDLPAWIDLESMRVVVPEGVGIVGLSLAGERLPPVARQPTPAVQAAQDEMARLEAVLRASAAEVAQIRLAAQAAQEQIASLRNLSQAGRDAPSNDELIALSRLIGDETLRALQAAHQAEQQAVAADL